MQVPKEYERAERLVLEGRLVEAERVLNKVSCRLGTVRASVKKATIHWARGRRG